MEFISVGALPRGFLPATISTSRTPTNVCIGRVVSAVDKSMQGDWKGDGWNLGVPSPVTETLEVNAPAIKPPQIYLKDRSQNDPIFPLSGS